MADLSGWMIREGSLGVGNERGRGAARGSIIIAELASSRHTPCAVERNSFRSRNDEDDAERNEFRST